MIAVAAAALALAGDPSVHPWPIGPGPRYTPTAPVPSGAPRAGLRCAAPGKADQVHLELFAGRKVIVVPAGIGVAGPRTTVGASVTPDGCVYPARTLTSTGIVQVAHGARLTLGDLFRIWGRRLGSRRLLSFTAKMPVRVYVGGRLHAGAAGQVALAPNAEIVVELGAYVPPHRFFLFPKETS